MPPPNGHFTVNKDEWRKPESPLRMHCAYMYCSMPKGTSLAEN